MIFYPVQRSLSAEDLKDLMNRFLSLENTFRSIITPTGKRMYSITFLCEIEYIHCRLQQMMEKWKIEYPIDIDREALKSYIDLLRSSNTNPDLYSVVYSNLISEESFTELRVGQRFGNVTPQKDKPDNRDNEEEPECYVKESLLKKMAKTFRVFTSNILIDKSPREEDINIDEPIFNNIFVNFCSLRNCFDMDVGFNEKGESKLREYRKFLQKINTEDLSRIIEMKYLMLQNDLEQILHEVDDPDDDVCKRLYYEASCLFDSRYSDHNNKNEHWKKHNSRKSDYAKQIRIRKDEIRLMIEGYGWGYEWQDLFEFEDNDIQASDIMVGSFIHFRLNELLANDNKLLFVFMGLLEDWLFFTWEEMVLLDSNNESNCTSEEKASIREDLNYIVPKKEEHPVNSPPIVVNGDYVVEKHIGNQVDYVAPGGIGITTKK